MTRIEYTEVHWVDDQPACSLRELAEASRLSESELRELVELGVLHPLVAAPGAVPGTAPDTTPDATDTQRFGAQCLMTMRAVRRLREDFELDAHGVSVALALLERIERLEHELRSLRARLPGASAG